MVFRFYCVFYIIREIHQGSTGAGGVESSAVAWAYSVRIYHRARIGVLYPLCFLLYLYCYLFCVYIIIIRYTIFQIYFVIMILMLLFAIFMAVRIKKKNLT